MPIWPSAAKPHLAVDPNNPQSWNRFAYVNGTPLQATDPLGLEEKAIDPCSDPWYADGRAECPTPIGIGIGFGSGGGGGNGDGIFAFQQALPNPPGVGEAPNASAQCSSGACGGGAMEFANPTRQIQSLFKNILDHIDEIEANPNSPALLHWRSEIQTWIDQILKKAGRRQGSIDKYLTRTNWHLDRDRRLFGRSDRFRLLATSQWPLANLHLGREIDSMSIARATTLLFLLAILMVFFAMSGFSVLRHGGTGMRIRRRCESVRPRLVIRALVASMHFLAATATGALACLVVVRTGLLNSFQGNWDIVAAALASIGASFVAIAKPEYFAEGIGKSHPDMSSADMEKLLRIVRILGFLSLPVVSAICFVAVRAVVG